jgi:hypothetical protein
MVKYPNSLLSESDNVIILRRAREEPEKLILHALEAAVLRTEVRISDLHGVRVFG